MFDMYTPMMKNKMIEDASRCVFRLYRSDNQVILIRNDIYDKINIFLETDAGIIWDRLILIKNNIGNFIPNFADKALIQDFLSPFKYNINFRRLSYLELLSFPTYAALHLEYWDKIYQKLQEDQDDNIIADKYWNLFSIQYERYIDNLRRIPEGIVNSFSQSILRGNIDTFKDFVYNPNKPEYSEFIGTLIIPDLTRFDEYDIAEYASKYTYDLGKNLDADRDITSYMLIKDDLYNNFGVDLATVLLPGYADRYIDIAFNEQITKMCLTTSAKLDIDLLLTGLTSGQINNIKTIKRLLDIYINSVYNTILEASRTTNLKMFLSFYPGSI